MPHKVWNNCLEIIKKHLPDHSVRTWFLPIKPLSLEKNILRLQVPSQFFYEWIEEHYLPVLRKAIHQAIGPEAKLEYSILMDHNQKSLAQMNLPQQSHLPQSSFSSNTYPNRSTYQKQDLNFPFEARLQDMMGRLHPKYTFDHFVSGSCNQMLKQAAEAISEQPNQSVFNPLVIYGNVGVGKTHLLQAIAHEMRQRHSSLQVIYLSGEQFISQFMLALRHKEMQCFSDLYLHADALLIDDIQFLKDKERTQDLFFHIFNHLHQGNKQLVFSCDTPPSELKGMHKRLISRFKWGLTLQLPIPNFDTRREILKQKASQEGISLPTEVLDYLAEEVSTHIRDLEGTLVSLLAHTMLSKRSLDLALAREVVSDHIQKVAPSSLSIQHIQQSVSEYFKLPEEDLLKNTRRREIVTARQIAMYLAKQHTHLSLSDIATHFGKRNHSTVVHALHTLQLRKGKESHIKQALAEIEKTLSVHAS